MVFFLINLVTSIIFLGTAVIYLRMPPSSPGTYRALAFAFIAFSVLYLTLALGALRG